MASPASRALAAAPGGTPCSKPRRNRGFSSCPWDSGSHPLSRAYSLICKGRMPSPGPFGSRMSRT
eukprot:10534246-Heterocapsa_arctica.AAC.1